MSGSLVNSLRENTLGISIFAVVTAGLIAITQVATKDTIVRNQQEQKAKALYEIIPETETEQDLLDGEITISAEALGYSMTSAYQAIQQGSVSSVILPVIAADGYSGDIDLIVGINADSTIAGVRVLTHKETPGLGDKIDLKKSDWILSFNGKTTDGSNDPRWAVKKDGGDFDQFTGATITPRAVVNAVGRTIDYFRANKADLLSPLAPPVAQSSKENTQ